MARRLLQLSGGLDDNGRPALVAYVQIVFQVHVQISLEVAYVELAHLARYPDALSFGYARDLALPSSQHALVFHGLLIFRFLLGHERDRPRLECTAYRSTDGYPFTVIFFRVLG